MGGGGAVEGPGEGPGGLGEGRRGGRGGGGGGALAALAYHPQELTSYTYLTAEEPVEEMEGPVEGLRGRWRDWWRRGGGAEGAVWALWLLCCTSLPYMYTRSFKHNV